tara:strand:+ start:3472 stop:4167 length:696 start_codon:yes stop_codon:yes gene_type:complete
MASTSLLNRIDSYVQTLFSDNKERVWTSAIDIANKFKLQLVETGGTTRIVLKKKGSRTVIKVGYPSHNRAEYAAYKALECSVLGDLLAPCLGVSKEGYALEMQFIPRAFPQARGEYYWFNPEFARMRDRLESHFSFIKNYNKYAWGADFHEENMRVMRKGDIKIIDYSNLLADMFSRSSKTTVEGAIKGILKLDFPKVDIQLTMKDRIISYRDNDVSYDVPVDPQRSEAII